jgi:predicted TPR repeat methyltransferase
VLPGPVEELRKRGYNVIVCDITKEKLDDRFDMIIAGDVIEHLGSPQGLFDAAANLLVPNGRMVISTPNPFYVHSAYRMFRGRFHESVDHVAHFDASNISEMAERAGLTLKPYRGIMSRNRAFDRSSAEQSAACAAFFGFSASLRNRFATPCSMNA